MKVDERVLSRLDDMIALGQQVHNTRRSPGQNFITDDFVDGQLANRWFTSCLNLFARVFGKDSEHYKSMNKQFKDYIKYPQVDQALGVLLSAKDDYENEFVFELKTLVEAELFDDFLEQANYLFSAGYHAPAAVIAGSVLEDGLRKQSRPYEC